MKIQFIIVGWHFDAFPELIDGLISLQKLNDSIEIFWACHREPVQAIKDNFKWKLFPNLGLEDGAYQQALDYLELEDDTVLFLLHDDLIIKDWSFINQCLANLIRGFRFVGNGVNYPASINAMDKPKGRDKRLVDYVKPEARYLFDSNTIQFKTLRESFICTTRGALRSIKDFEVVWEEPVPDHEGKYHIGGIGNMQQTLLSYKIYKVFGNNCIAYLSNTYQDSDYLYECARGKMN